MWSVKTRPKPGSLSTAARRCGGVGAGWGSVTKARGGMACLVRGSLGEAGVAGVALRGAGVKATAGERGVVVHQRMADRADGEFAPLDLADRRHLGGGAGQEHLLRAVEIGERDVALDDPVAAGLRQ